MAIRILIIEDEADLADFVVRGLREEGFTVEHALDGKEGWSAMHIGSWDLIVLDWGLPGEDGISLLRRFRTSSATTPVLFLTARAPGHSDLPKRIFLDLVEANRQQLLAVGLPAKGIAASPLCTYCRTDLLFSYRAEKGRTGRMMAVVGIQARPQESKGRSQSVRI